MKIGDILDNVVDFLGSFLFVSLCWFVAMSVGLADYQGFVLSIEFDPSIYENHELKVAMFYQAAFVSLVYNVALALFKVGLLGLESGITRIAKKYRRQKQSPAEGEA